MNIDFAKWLYRAGIALSHSKHKVHRVVALTVSKRDAQSKRKTEHYLQGRGHCHALTALQSGVLPLSTGAPAKGR